MVFNFQESELKKISKYLIKDFSSKIIRIDGPMGAGKTSLISSICSLLGVEESITSPTFSLVNTYNANHNKIHHFDFYRLEHADEALDFGLEEYLESGDLCFLEWAEKITPHLPLTYDHYTLQIIDDNIRKIESKKKYY